MRRRFRGHRRPIRRRAGMKGDWVVLAHTKCPFVGEHSQSCNTANESISPTFIALLDSQDVETKQDALTLVRMVGAINSTLFLTFEVTSPLASPVGGMVSCLEGIYKTTVSDDGNVFIPMNPWDDNDFEQDNWLWLRSTSFGLVIGGATDGFDNFILSAGAGTTSPPSAAQFDVRVKRKFERGEELIYVSQWLRSETLSTVTEGGSLPTSINKSESTLVTAALRGYVKF